MNSFPARDGRAALVVDASIVAKWFVTEAHSDTAISLLQGRFALLAPDFLLTEVGNVLLKKVRRGEMHRDDAEGAAEIIDVFVTLAESNSHYRSAFVLAADHNCSFYDALYVALALAEGCQLVTADRRLSNSLQGSLPQTMLWVEDLPSG